MMALLAGPDSVDAPAGRGGCLAKVLKRFSRFIMRSFRADRRPRSRRGRERPLVRARPRDRRKRHVALVVIASSGTDGAGSVRAQFAAVRVTTYGNLLAK